jgi:hypothetical protein
MLSFKEPPDINQLKAKTVQIILEDQLFKHLWGDQLQVNNTSSIVATDLLESLPKNNKQLMNLHKALAQRDLLKILVNANFIANHKSLILELALSLINQWLNFFELSLKKITKLVVSNIKLFKQIVWFNKIKVLFNPSIELTSAELAISRYSNLFAKAGKAARVIYRSYLSQAQDQNFPEIKWFKIFLKQVVKPVLSTKLSYLLLQSAEQQILGLSLSLNNDPVKWLNQVSIKLNDVITKTKVTNDSVASSMQVVNDLLNQLYQNWQQLNDSAVARAQKIEAYSNLQLSRVKLLYLMVKFDNLKIFSSEHFSNDQELNNHRINSPSRSLSKNSYSEILKQPGIIEGIKNAYDNRKVELTAAQQQLLNVIKELETATTFTVPLYNNVNQREYLTNIKNALPLLQEQYDEVNTDLNHLDLYSFKKLQYQTKTLLEFSKNLLMPG